MGLIDDILNVGLRSNLVLGRHPPVTGKLGGEWTGRPTESVGDATHRNIYPFLSEEIGVEIDTVQPTLNTGDSGPKKLIQGQSGLAGQVNFGVGEDQIGEILRWITGSDNQPSALDSTRQMTGGDIIASGTSVTVDTAQVPVAGKQPVDLAREPTSYAVTTKIASPCQVAQIQITVAGTISANKKGLLRIKGTDQYDRLLEEDIEFVDNYTTARTSVNFYKTVTSVLLANAAGNSAADNLPTSALTWQVEAVPDNYKYEFPMTSDRTPFYGMEVNFGGDDIITFLGLVVNQVTMNFGELIGLSVDLMGREARIGENLIGGNTPTDISGSAWTRPKQNLMTSMGVELWADGEQFFCSTLAFNMNQNYGFPETSFGSRTVFRRQPAHTATPRALSCGFTLDYRQSDKFDIKSFGEDIPVRLIYSTVPLGGNHSSIEFNMPQCTFAEAAVPTIPGGDPVYNAISLNPYATEPGNELTVYVRNAQPKAEFF